MPFSKVSEQIRSAIGDARYSLEFFATHGHAFAIGHQDAVREARVEKRALLLRAILQSPTTLPEPEREKGRNSVALLREAGWDIRLISAAPSATGIIVDRKFALVEDDERFAVHEITSRHELDEILAMVESLIQSSGNDLYFENLWRANLPGEASRIAVVSEETWSEVIPRLLALPEELRRLNPRKLEELVAELLSRDGFDIELTPPQKDGGRDVLAWRDFGDGSIGKQMYYVECKQWSKPVGVAIVRALYGVVEADHVTGGMLVTTSRFTKGALKFASATRNRIILRDDKSLQSWLRRMAAA